MLNVIEKDIGDVKPYEGNAKKHPQEQIDSIANSLREFGWRQPVVIDADGVIVAGHGRYFAAKQLGMEKVPCVEAKDLSPQQIQAYRLADNKTNESGWDFDMLSIELDSIGDAIDMSQFGFEAEQEVPDLQDYFTEEKNDNEKKKKTIVCPHCGEEIEIS